MVAKHVNKKNAGKPRVLAINALLHSLAALAALVLSRNTSSTTGFTRPFTTRVRGEGKHDDALCKRTHFRSTTPEDTRTKVTVIPLKQTNLLIETRALFDS